MTTAKDRERQEIEDAMARFRGEVKQLPGEVHISPAETRYHLGAAPTNAPASVVGAPPGGRGPSPTTEAGRRSRGAQINKKIKWLKRVKKLNDAQRKIKQTTI